MDYPDEKTHAITVDDPLNTNETVIIPLALKGVTIYFSYREPKASEYEYGSIPYIGITGEVSVRESSETVFEEQEDEMTDFRGEVISSDSALRRWRITNYLSTSEFHALDFTDDENFYKALNAKFNVDKVGASKGRHGVTSESLSQKWSISPEVARIIVQHTTKRGIRTILHLPLLRQFKTNY